MRINLQQYKRITIVGDIHGHLNDLLTILAIHGLPSKTNAYLFNGDFVDRGSASIECILLLLALKLHCPTSVFLNRGNHEAREVGASNDKEIVVYLPDGRPLFVLI